MTATAHALIGGAIAAGVQSQPLGIALAFASHPLADLVPHWDFGWGWRKKSKTTLFLQSVFDLCLGFTLSYFLFGQRIDFWYFTFAVFVSEVWDLVEAPYWFWGWKFPPFSWIYNIQSNMQGKTKTIMGGILTQIGAVATLVWVLRILR